MVVSFTAAAEPLFFRAEIRIVTAQGAHPFAVEIAASAPARRQGLQGRHYLASDAGMLFDFGQTRRITMWMKNTPVPLDMLFVRANGDIAHIVENAKPFSLKIIEAPEPARAVLEVKAGTVARLGIAPGDRIEHPLFAGGGR